MEDFIRLNFNAVVSLVLALAVMTIAFFFLLPKLSEGKDRQTLTFMYVITAIVAVLFFWVGVMHQASVNDVPRRSIDRSFIESSNQKYEKRVKSTLDTLEGDRK